MTQWCPKNSLPESNICNNPELADRYNRNCSGMLMCGNLVSLRPQRVTAVWFGFIADRPSCCLKRCYNDQKCAKCMSSRFDSWADAAPVYRCSDAGDVPTNYCNLKRRNPGKKPTCNCGDETGQLLPDQNQNLKSTSDFLALLPPASLVDPQSSQMDGFGNAVDFASTPVDYFTTPVVETINLGHDTANLADN